MNKQDSKKLGAVLDDIIFIPSPIQRKVKAAFWSSYNDNPLFGRDKITLAAVESTISDYRLHKWWAQIGFKEWFTNKDEFKQRLEYLANLALDTIEEVLCNPDANANARMNAAKLMLEAARKMPDKQGEVKYLDERVHTMSKKELEQFIKKALPSPGEAE